MAAGSLARPDDVTPASKQADADLPEHAGPDERSGDTLYSGYMTRSAAPRGVQLTSREGTVYRFDAGSLFLEFLLTGGPGDLARYDTLGTPVDLATWAGACRLGLDRDRLDVTGRDISAGRALRDALWRLTRRSIRRSGMAAGAPADLAIVNRAAARPSLVPQVGPEGRSGWLLPATGPAVLSTVARDAIEVLAGPSAARLRECEAADCYLLFLDTSRPGRRRWCSMQRCGNRHKVRALRSRRSTTNSGSTHHTLVTSDQHASSVEGPDHQEGTA